MKCLVMYAHAVIILAIFGFCYASDDPTENDIINPASAINQFSLDLLKNVYQNGENTFFSGFSITVAFGMVSLGARENTLTEIDNTFHFDKTNENDQKAIHKVFKSCIEIYNLPNINYALSTANRLYMQDNFSIGEEFKDDIKQYYSSEVHPVDFSTGTAEYIINSWVAKQTNDKIKNLIVPGVLSASTVLVLVNAIYFAGAWDLQFDTALTITDKFYTSKMTEVSVEMMDQTNYFNYHSDTSLNVEVLELPYKGKDLSMFIILPDDVDGLSVLVESLTITELESLINSVKDTYLRVMLPKFNLETEYSLVEVLEKLGIKDLFNEKCDLSAIAGVEQNDKFEVTDVFHKAVVQVDEWGTEAAGVVEIPILLRTTPSVITVNRPFLFIIRDSGSGIILFTGTVSDLAAAEISTEPLEGPIWE